jgi:hypothetical protein
LLTAAGLYAGTHSFEPGRLPFFSIYRNNQVTTTSFQVGSVFEIIDRASPVIAKLSREVSDFAKIVADTKAELRSLGNLKLGGLNTNLKTATDQVVALKDAAVRASGSIESSAKKAATSIEQITLQWRNAERAALAAGAASNGVAGTGRGSPRNILGSRGSGVSGGLSFRSHHTAVPGGYIHGGNNAALVGAGALAYGAFEGLTASDLVWKGLANVFPEGTPEDRGRKATELLDIVKREAKKIGQSPTTVAKIALDEIKVNSNLSWKDRLAMMPQVIESGAREAYVKGLASPESAVSAFVGQLHQAKAFTPEEVASMGPMLAYFAAKDPNSIVNIAKSSAYHLPTLTGAMGVPVAEDLSAQTTLDQLGVGGKSGTWIRQMSLKAAHPYLPLNASKAQTASYEQQMAELKSLGLIDESGNTTIMRDGHYSTQLLLHKLSDNLQNVPMDQRANKLQKVFGAQGSYAISALTDPKMLQRYDQTLAGAGNISSNEKFWSEQGKYNPMQQARSAFSDLQVVLLEIGQNTLPTIVNLLKGFDAGLSGINKTLGSGMFSRIIGAAIGASVGGKLGAPGAVGGAIIGGALGGGGLPQIGPKSSAPDLLDLLTKQNDDAAKKTEDATEKGAESGVVKGFLNFLKKGVTGGFSPISFRGAGSEVAKGAKEGTFAGIQAALGGAGAGGLINASYETPDGGGGFTTKDGVTVPNSELGNSGAVPTGPGGGPLGRLTSNKRQVAGIVADAWRKAGMSDTGIAGLMANIGEESSFNPTLRHADQPRFGGEAHFAHGLYQEGGMEWNHFAAWIGKNYPGADWRDPKLQSEFAAWNLNTNYPGVWNRMVHGNSAQAAAAYAAGYLKPAARYLAGRLGKFSHGVPGLDAYIGHHDKAVEPGTSPSNNVIPPHRSAQPIVIHTNLQLDGRTVAKNTMKHMASNANKPASGARLPDYWTTRPTV